MIRIAAVGDLHLGQESAGRYRAQLARLPEDADVLLVAGDLTRLGTQREGDVVATELREVGVPVVVVLGNHDYHSDQQDRITDSLRAAGIHVLEGTAVTLEIGGCRVGIAGTKGFGGGFPGASCTAFGEREMKAFIEHSRDLADGLREALAGLETEIRIALMHYAPIRETLTGEPPEIFAFLGSYLLAEAIDAAGADLALHGHAHAGAEKGMTPGGVLVRNVAQPVIDRAYHLYALEPKELAASRA